MAQEEAVNVRVDPLGDDDAVELAEQYRMERQMERVGEPVVRSHASTMIAAPKPISQAELDHWHTKADKSTVTVAKLEAIREKYQVPVEIELLNWKKMICSSKRRGREDLRKAYGVIGKFGLIDCSNEEVIG
ncbi:hypothetical protein CsSME_00053853 [Camellia sinensis var. sinensis]